MSFVFISIYFFSLYTFSYLLSCFLNLSYLFPTYSYISIVLLIIYSSLPVMMPSEFILFLSYSLIFIHCFFNDICSYLLTMPCKSVISSLVIFLPPSHIHAIFIQCVFYYYYLPVFTYYYVF